MHSMKSRFVGRVVDRTARAGFVGLVALTGVATSACSGGVEGSNGEPAPPPILQDGSAIACRQTEFGTEAYQLSAMNNKLRYYPDFAGELGMDSVSDCEGARAFMLGYANYREKHPGFDHDQPMDRTPRVKPTPPDDLESTLEWPKILNGKPSLREAVVATLFQKANGETALCSGTFIAKNWVLTAAHCITESAVKHCPVPVTPATCDPQFSNYSRWTFRRATGPEITTSALAYVPRDWVGADLSQDPDIVQPTDPGVRRQMMEAMSERDYALLYLYDDRVLPPEIEPPLSAIDPTNRPTLRVNIEKPPTDLLPWGLYFYGWGLPLGDPQEGEPPGEILQRAQKDPTTMRFLPLPDPDSEVLIGAQTTNASRPCKGDSGAPLIRKRSVPTRGGIADQEVIVAVSSYGEGPCTKPTNNLDLTFWTRVDLALPFIEESLADWNGPDYHCTPLPPGENPSSNQDVTAECWGEPCFTDNGCEFNEFCSRPGDSFKDQICSVCGGGVSTSCDCIAGQCLPKIE